MINQYGTSVTSSTGKVLTRSKNLRALLRYNAVSPVATVRAMPCPSNPFNGKLVITYSDGASSTAHFADYRVMLDWLAERRWHCMWDIAAPALGMLDGSMRRLEKLHSKGRF